MIEIKNLSFHYSQKRPVYRNLNLKIEKGSVSAILGLNGAGKTTLLNLISGFLIPKEGSCKVCYYESSKRYPEMLQELFLVSDISEFPNMIIDKFRKLYADFYPRFDTNLFANCLAEFNLSPQQSLKHLSFGEKRKVMLSFALATHCKLLLFDEPTNGLDIPSKSTFRKMIAANLEEDQTILLATHQVRDLGNLMDRIIIEHQGKIILSETTEHISEKLLFGMKVSDVHPNDLFYSDENVASNECVAINRNGYSGKLDIEQLFNAAISNPQKLISVFND